ncbi:MAG: prolipoprotein diacylglyceryl transferase [Bacteroidales bacterium]|nr:prolipoprotein diacylglyceryl transferase [Bacteroidales bacterium]
MLNYIVWAVKPEIFSVPDDVWLVGGLTVRWYGLLFACAFIFGYIIMQRIFKKEGIPIKMLDDLTTYMVISVIVGARLGHCLFYEPAYYLSHPVEILKIWEGGLASHGASIGILIGLYIFSRRNHKPYIWIMDRIVIVVALGGFFVRMGNLMNSEIFGDITTLPWGFVFENYYDPQYATDPRHPTQIYEALSYLFIFLITCLIYRKNDGHPRPGKLFGVFLVLLFGMRFFIEFIKIPQVGFEEQMTLNMGQWLSIPFVLAGVIMLLWSQKQKEEPK